MAVDESSFLTDKNGEKHLVFRIVDIHIEKITVFKKEYYKADATLLQVNQDCVRARPSRKSTIIKMDLLHMVTPHYITKYIKSSFITLNFC